MAKVDHHLERVRRLAEATRRSQECTDDTRSTRDRAVLEANEAGHSYSAVAKAAGLSRGSVSNVVYCALVARQAELDAQDEDDDD